MTPERPLLKVDEVAALLGISPRHFTRLVGRGDAPAPIRLGESIRWRRGDIDKWIADGCPSGCATPGGQSASA